MRVVDTPNDRSGLAAIKRALIIALGLSCLGTAAPIKTFIASEIGLKPGTGADCSAAFSQALRTVLSNDGPTELVLAEGDNRIGGPGITPANSNFNYSLGIPNAKSFTLRGAGDKTRLIAIRASIGLFSVNDGENIAFKDFSVDMDPPNFTQGTIESARVEDGTYTLRLDPGFPGFDNAQVFPNQKQPGGRGYVFVPRTPGDPKGGFAEYGIPRGIATERLGDRLWRLKLSPYSFNDPKTFEAQVKRDWGSYHLVPGHKSLIQNTSTQAGTFWIYGCKNTTLENLTFHATVGLVVRIYFSEGVTVRRMQVRIREGSPNLLSASADALHFAAVRGPILIEDCLFEHQGDDHINIHEPLENVISNPEPQVLVLDGNARSYRPGDRLLLVNQVLKQRRAEAVVTSVEKVTNSRYLRVLIDRPVSNLAAFDPVRDQGGKIGETKCDIAWNLSRASGPTTIRRCTFRKGGAILPNLVGGLIENNVFENTGGACAIRMGYTTSIYSEGPSASEMVIRSNVFRRQSRLVNNMPVISCHFWPTNPKGRLSQNLTIQGNRFIDCGTTSIYLRAISNVSILGNRIEAAVDTPRAKKLEWFHTDAAQEGDGYPAVFLDHCEGVLVDELTVIDSGVKAAIMIGKQAEIGTRGVKIVKLRATLGKGVPEVMDLRE